jgi:hypothetical protein
MNMKTNVSSDCKLKVLTGLSILAIACLCWNGGTAIQAQGTPATQNPQVQEVVKLSQAKMSDDVILSYIRNSGASYALSADDILYLNSQGVSQPVISALLQSKSAAPAPLPVVATPATPAPVVAAPQVSPYPTATPVATPPPAEPPPGSDMTLPYFQTQLAPYGSWVDVPGEGLCWVPSVQGTIADWRPYLNDGHWVYTDDGWSWQSDYPWGEYTFHYGRWFRDARFGWMWRPGYHWAPAWVSWRHAEGEGFVGWAPLPPEAVYQPGVGLMWNGRLAVDVDFGLAPDAFVFIPYDHFWLHDYVRFRAPYWRVPVLFRGSVRANHYSFVGGRVIFEGIPHERMAVLTHHEVCAERVEFHDSHIAHSREIEHTQAVERGHSVSGHDSRDSRDSHDSRDNRDSHDFQNHH